MARKALLLMILSAALLPACLANAQGIRDSQAPDRWVDATAQAPGIDISAQEAAVKLALRKAVEQGCGVFLKSESKGQDYSAVYDRIFADSVGYVREYKVVSVKVGTDTTTATVRARVSTQKFEKDWAVIAHTIHQENNPRVVIVATDASWTHTAPSEETMEASVVQGKLEDFFLEKGIQLMDRGTARNVNKRDLLLASIKDDAREVAALGAKFDADVVLTAKASAKYGKEIIVGGQRMYQYVATLTVRAIRCDSAQTLVSKSYECTVNSLQQGGGREKALAKLAEEQAPAVLKALVEAWRKQVHVSRNINLTISGMTFAQWEAFSVEAKALRGMQNLRLREITEGVANIDVEYDLDTETLAKAMKGIAAVKLTVTEFNANRLKMKVVE